MAVDLNTYLGIHAQALRVRSQRTELLANNLANADTPGFKARDIDFRQALAAAGSKNTPVRGTTTNAAHIATGNVAAGGAGGIRVRKPPPPRAAGRHRRPQTRQTPPLHKTPALP